MSRHRKHPNVVPYARICLLQKNSQPSKNIFVSVLSVGI
jgi:hypothetical protein